MSDQQITTKTAWRKSRDHTITLPSANVVKIRVPNLPALARAGEIPNALLTAAQAAVQAQAAQAQEGFKVEDLVEVNDYHRWVVSIMLIDPQIGPEEVDDLPYEDIELLVQLAARQRDQDAIGHQLAGLEANPEWSKFRGEQLGIAALLGLQSQR